GKVVADGNNKAGRLECGSRFRERVLICFRLPDQLDQIGRLGVAKAEPREADNVRAFVTAIFPGVRAQAFGAKLDGNERKAAMIGERSEFPSGVRTDNDEPAIAIPRGLLQERMISGERSTLSCRRNSISHVQAPN